MVTFFPVHRPRFGLSFGARALTLIELRRPWFRQRVVRRTVVRSLPCGALRPSASEVNIVDRDVVVQALRELTAICRDRTVAVSLPDETAHIRLFEFETLPQQEQEREVLLRWRFQQDLDVSFGDARLASRVFPGSPEGGGPLASTPVARVIAMLVSQKVLNQYEDVCEAAGLIPVSVGVPSLQLFDLHRSVMKPREELLFVYRTEERLAFWGIRQGQPVFLRIKSIHGAPDDLMTDLLGTLQFYDDQHPHQGGMIGGSPVRLYVVTGGLAGEAAQPIGGLPQILRPNGNQAWQVEVVPVGWRTLPMTTRVQDHSLSGLSALASVVVC